MLARTVAHTVDVDAMLASMTPAEFDEWLAMYAIRPWGIEPPTEPEKPESDLKTSLNAMRGMTGM